MPTYEYRGQSPFQDNRNDRVIEPGDVVELPASVVGRHAFVEVDDPSEDAAEESGDVPVAEKDYSELRQMAKNAETDEINGRSSKEEIVAFFSDSGE